MRWNPCGIHDHSMWIPYRHSIWNDGKVMEYDHSRWIPYGIKVEWNDQNGWDTSQNIFHMEWMESTWIPCGIWGQSKDLCGSITSDFVSSFLGNPSVECFLNNIFIVDYFGFKLEIWGHHYLTEIIVILFF